MKRPTTASSFRALATVAGGCLVLVACESTDKPGGMTGASNIFLDDTNNYHSTSALMLPTVETISGGDIEICWPNVTKDLQCHDVVPLTDLDNVGFLRFLHLTEADVEATLAAGPVSMSQLSGYVEYHTDHASTCARLSQFSFFGTPLKLNEEFVESSDATYMLIFNKGTKLGLGARAMIFVKPTAVSVNTRVDAASGCGLLDFHADLSSLSKVAIPAKGPWVIDWRGVMHDGLGNGIIYTSISSVLIGFYEGKTVADLEAGIFDIEQSATAMWELPLTGARSADLAQAKLRGAGTSFPGFTTPNPGVWMLGLMCADCQNPAPVVMTILEPTGGG